MEGELFAWVFSYVVAGMIAAMISMAITTNGLKIISIGLFWPIWTIVFLISLFYKSIFWMLDLFKRN